MDAELVGRTEYVPPFRKHPTVQSDVPAQVSFALRYSGLYLHQNFVAAVLNDVFGVQSRGGCACAGPYAQCSPSPPPGSATH